MEDSKFIEAFLYEMGAIDDAGIVDTDKVVTLRGINRREDRERVLNASSTEERLLTTLFARDSATSKAVIYETPREFTKLFGSLNRSHGSYVSPEFLDPFVARFIHAVAEIQIYTFFSCDGWHSSRKEHDSVRIKFSDRYSLQWLLLLLNKDYDLAKLNIEFQLITDIDSQILLTDENRLSVYVALNKAAEVMENKRATFLETKRIVVEEIKGMKKSPLTGSEIYELLSQHYEHAVQNEGMN